MKIKILGNGGALNDIFGIALKRGSAAHYNTKVAFVHSGYGLHLH